MAVKISKTINWSVVLILCLSILSAGCSGPKIRIDDRVEPFRTDHPIVPQISLWCLYDKLESTGPHGLPLPLFETFCEKSEEALLKSGLAQTVVKVNSADSRMPTLRTVASITYEGNIGMVVVKSIVFTLLFPLLPFMQHTVTYTVSADLFVIQSQQSTQAGTFSSTLHLTRTLGNAGSFNEADVIPLIAEDVSWKIALELKRHPDWLRPAHTTGTP
jgi:hypothetical protein